MQNDLKLVSGTDTVPCTLFHYVRNFDLAPYAEFVLAFKSSGEKTNADKELIFDGTSLGISRCIFLVKNEDISGVPQLITQ